MSDSQRTGELTVLIDRNDVDALREQSLLTLEANHHYFEEIEAFGGEARQALARIYRDAFAVLDALGWDAAGRPASDVGGVCGSVASGPEEDGAGEACRPAASGGTSGGDVAGAVCRPAASGGTTSGGGGAWEASRRAASGGAGEGGRLGERCGSGVGGCLGEGRGLDEGCGLGESGGGAGGEDGLVAVPLTAGHVEQLWQRRFELGHANIDRVEHTTGWKVEDLEPNRQKAWALERVFGAYVERVAAG